MDPTKWGADCLRWDQEIIKQAGYMISSEDFQVSGAKQGSLRA